MSKFMRKTMALMVIFSFVVTTLISPRASYAQMTSSNNTMPWMSTPGMRVALSQGFTPAHILGMKINPKNALEFDFLIHKGDNPLPDDQKKAEYNKLIKYFLASLAVPDKDQWVNLSPYEKDRIINTDFGKTEMGRDLLSQDYMLKQITASLIYPEEHLGQKFWDQVFAQAYKEYGTTDIPVSTFNKVWIVPDEAIVYEKDNAAYILKSHLKVMLEEDYLALKNNSLQGQLKPKDVNQASGIMSKVVRDIVLPALEKEVNEGKNFALLRQMCSSMILATWYKQALKESLLGKIYVDKAKVKGVDQDPQNNEKIYQRYLQAFKKGVYNYIKEEQDKNTHQAIPRKYFSGGFERAPIVVVRESAIPANLVYKVDLAMQSLNGDVNQGNVDEVTGIHVENSQEALVVNRNAAMNTENIRDVVNAQLRQSLSQGINLTLFQQSFREAPDNLAHDLIAAGYFNAQGVPQSTILEMADWRHLHINCLPNVSLPTKKRNIEYMRENLFNALKHEILLWQMSIGVKVHPIYEEQRQALEKMARDRSTFSSQLGLIDQEGSDVSLVPGLEGLKFSLSLVRKNKQTKIRVIKNREAEVAPYEFTPAKWVFNIWTKAQPLAKRVMVKGKRRIKAMRDYWAGRNSKENEMRVRRNLAVAQSELDGLERAEREIQNRIDAEIAYARTQVQENLYHITRQIGAAGKNVSILRDHEALWNGNLFMLLSAQERALFPSRVEAVFNTVIHESFIDPLMITIFQYFVVTRPEAAAQYRVRDPNAPLNQKIIDGFVNAFQVGGVTAFREAVNSWQMQEQNAQFRIDDNMAKAQGAERITIQRYLDDRSGTNVSWTEFLEKLLVDILVYPDSQGKWTNAFYNANPSIPRNGLIGGDVIPNFKSRFEPEIRTYQEWKKKNESQLLAIAVDGPEMITLRWANTHPVGEDIVTMKHNTLLTWHEIDQSLPRTPGLQRLLQSGPVTWDWQPDIINDRLVHAATKDTLLNTPMSQVPTRTKYDEDREFEERVSAWEIANQVVRNRDGRFFHSSRVLRSENNAHADGILINDLLLSDPAVQKLRLSSGAKYELVASMLYIKWVGGKGDDLYGTLTLASKPRSSAAMNATLTPARLTQAPVSLQQERYGGIDFNSANLNLQIKRDSKGISLPVSQQDLDHINISGLIPVIFAVKPITEPLF